MESSVAQVTVVTIAKDKPVGLLRTILSVQEQDTDSWNLCLVVPRISKETYEIAKEFENHPKIFLLEDFGVGIYEAMNLAIGDLGTKYVWFLNAGDCFANSSSLRVGIETAENLQADLIIGRHSIQGGKKFGTRNSYRLKSRVNAWQFAFARKLGCHQSMVFKSTKVSELGGFDVKYRLASDFDLALRVIEFKNSYWSGTVLASIEPGGAADINLKKVFVEKHEIRGKLFESRVATMCSLVWSFMAISKGYLKSNLLFRNRK